MRLRAKEVVDSAIEHGHMHELTESRATLDDRLRNLCMRDEVKDWLHAMLVRQMSAFHASLTPEELKLLDERPDDQH
jgi:hypothetical protein